VNSITTFAKHPNTSMGTTVRVVVQFRRVLNMTFALHVNYAVKSVKIIYSIPLLDAVRIIKNYLLILYS